MKKALVVGINDYPKSPLKMCINDAKGIGRLLKTNSDGSANFDTKIETDIKTKSQLMSMIANFFNKGNCDTAVFYFSGHGFLNELGGYIVTPDHAEYDVGISMDEILSLANQSEIRNKIIILDCCHSGVLGSPKSGGTVTPIKTGISILTACRENELAIGMNGHGIFTNLLISALEGGAADLRGHVSPGGIYSYVDQALGAHDQRPVFKTNVTEFVSLRTINPRVSTEIIRKITQYFNEENEEYRLDPSYEDTNNNAVHHPIKEPYSKPENVAIFKNLQKFQSIGLVVPVDEDFMYFAAMNSKACKLTALGHHYWRLVKDSRI
ncbi:MAG TPA: caspase family protein [Bacteroidia bacterium]|jgi:hypothetical protein|nr:caspase family protein [Bacteroidia bacterium]